LALKLNKDGSTSVPRITWGKYKEEVKREKPPPQRESADVNSLKLRYAVHPDLPDDEEWGYWIKKQNEVGNIHKSKWDTVKKRKFQAARLSTFDKISFLFDTYTVNCWFWEMLEMLRK
jgi:hypothetical protein